MEKGRFVRQPRWKTYGSPHCYFLNWLLYLLLESKTQIKYPKLSSVETFRNIIIIRKVKLQGYKIEQRVFLMRFCGILLMEGTFCPLMCLDFSILQRCFSHKHLSSVGFMNNSAGKFGIDNQIERKRHQLMLYNKLFRVVQAHLLGFRQPLRCPGNAFACSARFIRLFPSPVA